MAHLIVPKLCCALQMADPSNVQPSVGAMLPLASTLVISLGKLRGLSRSLRSAVIGTTNLLRGHTWRLNARLSPRTAIGRVALTLSCANTWPLAEYLPSSAIRRPGALCFQSGTPVAVIFKCAVPSCEIPPWCDCMLSPHITALAMCRERLWIPAQRRRLL